MSEVPIKPVPSEGEARGRRGGGEDHKGGEEVKQHARKVTQI